MVSAFGDVYRRGERPAIAAATAHATL